MPRWHDVRTAVPELAEAVERRFGAHAHAILGTLRRDGAPRLSGIETAFRAGELWLGMMPGSRKALDLRRDPRMSVHSAPVEPDLADGDARIDGRAAEVTDRATLDAFRVDQRPPPGSFHLFRIDVERIALVRVVPAEGALVITSWSEATRERRDRRA